jgi:hypothetical protein
MEGRFVDAIEVFKGEDGWRFREVSGEGAPPQLQRKLAVSEAYSSVTEARTAADKLAAQLGVDVWEVEE